MPRKRLQFDPLFGPHFFVCEQEMRDLSVRVEDFILPDSALTLEFFFLSEEGQQFKAGVNNLIDLLAEWARSYAIDIAPLQSFRVHYIDYHGTNIEINHFYMPLYQIGIPALMGIIDLITLDIIPLDCRMTIIKNLIFDLDDICGPGVYVNFRNAYLDLSSYLNLNTAFTAYRRRIATQAILLDSKRILSQSEKKIITAEVEMHFVNGILNEYAKDLAIEKVEDSAIEETCFSANSIIVYEKLRQQFASIIQRKLLVEKLLAEFLLEAKNFLSIFLNEINQSLDFYNERRIEFFEKLNKRFGVEKQSFYLVSDLIETQDLKNYSQNWKADFYLGLSLIDRLEVGEYLQIKKMQQQFNLAPDVIIYWIPDRSLKFAYAEYHGHDQVTCYPFLSFFVDVFSGMIKTNKDSLQQWTDTCLIQTMRFEIIDAIEGYLKSISFQKREDKSFQAKQLMDSLLILLPITEENRWRNILRTLPAENWIILPKFFKLSFLTDHVKYDTQFLGLLREQSMTDVLDCFQRLTIRLMKTTNLLKFFSDENQCKILLKFLKQKNADELPEKLTDLTPLFLAICMNHLKACYEFIQEGVDTFKEVAGRSTLDWAILFNHVEISKVLQAVELQKMLETRETMLQNFTYLTHVDAVRKKLFSQLLVFAAEYPFALFKKMFEIFQQIDNVVMRLSYIIEHFLSRNKHQQMNNQILEAAMENAYRAFLDNPLDHDTFEVLKNRITIILESKEKTLTCSFPFFYLKRQKQLIIELENFTAQFNLRT